MAGQPRKVVSGKERFLGGFCEFLGDKETCDAVVAASGVEHPVHRLLLMHASRFFRKAFTLQMREKSTARVSWEFPDPQRVFGPILAWIYGSDLVLDVDNVIAVAAAAHQLEIPDLERVCSEFITDALSPRVALALLHSTASYAECGPLGLTDKLVSCERVDRPFPLPFSPDVCFALLQT